MWEVKSLSSFGFIQESYAFTEETEDDQKLIDGDTMVTPARTTSYYRKQVQRQVPLHPPRAPVVAVAMMIRLMMNMATLTKKKNKT